MLRVPRIRFTGHIKLNASFAKDRNVCDNAARNVEVNKYEIKHIKTQ